MLLEDFSQRCAYTLLHAGTVHQKEMHVDHHNPKLKRKSRYENLFPAYGPCNESKSDHWPTDAQMAEGIRFLNPCRETDYNEQVFEDPDTHELVGTTVAARYHILMLDLNSHNLVEHRRERAILTKAINIPVMSRSGDPNDDATLLVIIRSFTDLLKLKIPAIKPPPVV
jgi:hypothetical protein